jgi:hypothetical protein
MTRATRRPKPPVAVVCLAQRREQIRVEFHHRVLSHRAEREAHATLDRISIVADNLDAAMVKAKLLFDTLDMPQKPDGLRILDQAKQELFVWKPDDHDA